MTAAAYLPTLDGHVVNVGRTMAQVMTVAEARIHMLWVAEMACHRNPLISAQYSREGTQLCNAIIAAERAVRRPIHPATVQVMAAEQGAM